MFIKFKEQPVVQHWHSPVKYAIGVKLSTFWYFAANFLTHYIKQT